MYSIVYNKRQLPGKSKITKKRIENIEMMTLIKYKVFKIDNTLVCL